MVTPWEEPLDVYYMHRANYVDPARDPMVYIVSHNWADRFVIGRRRATIEVYSNCDSVLLYNDLADNAFLGKKKQHGVGTHFMWENRDIRYNVLRAVGYYAGHVVCEDVLVLNGLEQAPHFETLYSDAKPLLKGEDGFTYLYRVNCGGDAYTDTFGQVWEQDNTKYSHSWAEGYKDLNPYLASQRITNDPIHGTRDWKLFQHFRFGRHKLNYRFPLQDGEYRLELYFVEPWHGTGGSAGTDCEGLRIFDVAVNGETVIDDLDLWAEAGHDVAIKKVVDVLVKNGMLCVDFLEVKAGQAIISGIAIAKKGNVSDTDIAFLRTKAGEISSEPVPSDMWASFSRDTISKTPAELLPEDKTSRMNVSYEAEAAIVRGKYVKKEHRKQTGVFFEKGNKNSIEWNISTGLAQVYALRFKYMNLSGKPITVRMQFIAANGQVLKDDKITFPDTPEKWRMMSTTTGTYVNAGYYKVVLSAEDMNKLAFDALDVQ